MSAAVRRRQATNQHGSFPVCVTEAEKMERRRLAWRESKRRQRAEYRALCEEHNETPLPTKFTEHMRALQARPESPRQFWRSRFTQQEIDDLWAAVSLYLDVPEAA